MTEPRTSTGTDANSVWKVVSVQAPQAVAWRVFTEKMGAWWPLAYYKIGKANAVDAVIEPHAGGRWYERGDDGSTCQWGSVLAWEPPSRLLLSWDISADWIPLANSGRVSASYRKTPFRGRSCPAIALCQIRFKRARRHALGGFP
jgi:uncharacterized protein YndB with AHSA1/START domain